MRKFLIVALTAASMVWANVSEPIEIIGNERTWWTAEAENTSSATIVGGNGNHSPISATIVLGSATRPWATVVTALGSQQTGFTSLTGLQSISITYTATGALRLSLSSPIGIDDGTGFRRELLAAATPTLVNIPLNTIVRPNWEGVEQIDVATVLDQITGFGLTVPFGTGGEFTVTSLVLNFGDGGNPDPGYVPVTGITGVPTTATVGTPLTLSGTVAPTNATNSTIVWSIATANTTAGATITGGNTLNTTTVGTVIVSATIANGLTETTPFTRDFNITVSPASTQQFTISWNSANCPYPLPQDEVCMGWVEPINEQWHATVNAGTQIVITATAAQGHRFAGWQGITSTANPLTVTVNSDTTITATFEPTGATGPFSVTFAANPADFSGGWIESPQVPGGYAAAISAGTQITLTAVPADRYRFVSWQGIASTANPLTVTVNSDTTITAVFEETNYLEVIGWSWTNDQGGTDYFTWTSYYDPDSYVDISNQNPLTAALSLGVADANWSQHLGLGAWFADGFLSNLIAIEVTYTADMPVRLAVGLRSGNSTTDYIAQLQPSDVPTTTTLELRDFLRPGHVAVGIDNLCLADRENFSGVTFSHGIYGQTVNLTVTSLKLFFGTAPTDCNPTGIVSNARVQNATNRITVSGISAGRLNLNVPTAGAYTVGIYSVDGRQLAHTKANLVQGANSLTIGNNLARGVAIVRIQGTNASLVRRISVR